MSKRTHVIKQTKDKSFATSNFEISKGLIQASTLGLRPVRPDFDQLQKALDTPGATVAYELVCDGRTLSFDVRFGKQRKTLATSQLAAFKSLDDRRRVMGALHLWGLVDAKAVPASADEVRAKEKVREQLAETLKAIGMRLRSMAYEQSVTDIARNDIPPFLAFVRKHGGGHLVDLYVGVQANERPENLYVNFLADRAPRLVKQISASVRKSLQGQSIDDIKRHLYDALDRFLKAFQAAATKLLTAQSARLEKQIKAVDAGIQKMTA